MAGTYLNRTSGTSTNAQKFTMSFWVKRSALGAVNMLFYSGTGGTANGNVDFTVNDTFDIYERDASSVSWQLTTNRVFRDVGAWYHIVIEADSTQATSTDRVKIYVNGVQETSFGTSTYPNQNISFEINKSSEVRNIGKYTTPAPYYFDGLFTHFHFIDGTAYDASAFGQTDATTGIWKAKTSPSVTYGTNGFFLKFENSGSMGTDSSGNANNFTVNGTLTQTVDTPTNVFATMNPLHKSPNVTLSNGNLTCVGSGTYSSVGSTLAVSTGKWYWEAKCNTASPNNYFNVGILKTDIRIDNLAYPADIVGGYVYAIDGNIYGNASTLLQTGTTISVGDIVGFLLDLDNGTLKLKKNGSDVYSGNAVVSSLNTGDFWYVAQGANPSNVDFNFGNGYFGTTAVSSATTDESGLGIFEYTVPSGYYALCTKNINEQEYD